MKHIHWGFIGCGEVVEKKSGPAFAAVEGSDVVAVMSRSVAKARSYAERHNINRWYVDAQELINDEQVNAVYVATPPSSHATFAIMSMRAGKPVYVEKPLASTYEDCVRVNRVSEQTGIPCYVAYYRRYLPYFQRVKKIIEDGSIGRIMNVRIRFSCPPRPQDHRVGTADAPWRLQKDISGGGYFYDLAPHQLDLLQELFGIITHACGMCANRAGLYEAEDTISACFQFEDGMPGSGSWCFVGHQSAQEDCIEVVGEKGRLAFSVFNYDPILLDTSEGTTSIRVPNPPYVQMPIVRSVIQDLQGFNVCSCKSLSATPVNWVMDKILGKF